MDNVNNILVVGNGFDLHHGLPTRYTDFIEKVRELRNIDNPDKECDRKIKEYSLGNPFMEYFIKQRDAGDNWIDFEKEIGEIIESFSFILNKVENDSKNIKNFAFKTSQKGILQ